MAIPVAGESGNFLARFTATGQLAEQQAAANNLQIGGWASDGIGDRSDRSEWPDPSELDGRASGARCNHGATGHRDPDTDARCGRGCNLVICLLS